MEFRAHSESQWASLVAQLVKNLPAMKETRVLSLGQEDPLEKGMATHFRILAWRIPWTEELVGHSPWGHRESDSTEPLTLYHYTIYYVILYRITGFQNWQQCYPPLANSMHAVVIWRKAPLCSNLQVLAPLQSSLKICFKNFNFHCL